MMTSGSVGATIATQRMGRRVASFIFGLIALVFA